MPAAHARVTPFEHLARHYWSLSVEEQFYLVWPLLLLLQYRSGPEEYGRKWSDAGARIVVLADPPLNGSVRDENRVALNPADPVACAVDRSVAQPPDPLAELAGTMSVPGVTLVDLTRPCTSTTTT